MSKIVAKARVQVLLDIELNDHWDGNATIGDIHKYVADSARGQISHLLEAKAKGSTPGELVIPDPSVYQRIRVAHIKTVSVSTEVD